MNTQTNATTSQAGNYQKHDAVNCLFNCGIYFYNGLIDYATGKPLYTRKNGQQIHKTYMKYHLRYTDDINYQGFQSEMASFLRIIKTNAQNNSIKRVLLYRNHNKGETIANVQNLQVLQISFKNNEVLSHVISNEIPADYKTYFEEFINVLKAELG